MSDSPEARPGAPKSPVGTRPHAPTVVGLGAGGGVKPPSPSSPSLPSLGPKPPVAPRIPASSRAPAAPTTPRVLPDTRSSQNVVGSGDTEEMELRSSAVIPAAEEFRPPLPSAPLVAKRASSPDLTPRAPLSSQSDVAAQADVAERVQAVVAEVLASALLPVIEKQRELEARLEILRNLPPMRAPARSAAASIDITGSLTPPAPSMPPGKVVATSYGLVSVLPGPPPRPAIEVALEKVGPIDVPDFGRSRRLVGRIVITILILGVLGAIAATVLSYR